MFLGAAENGEEFSSRLLSLPNVLPNSPRFQLGQLGFAEGERICFALGGFGDLQDLQHLSPHPSPIPAPAPLSWREDEKVGLGGFRNSSGEALSLFDFPAPPRGAASAPQQHQEKTGSFFLTLNFKPGHL